MAVSLSIHENADRLARLFQEIARDEVRWMIRFGAVCGFVIGVLEAFVYMAFERWWLLPAIGAFDGLLNNWLAIQMIFRPIEPTRYLGLFTYQGLFPKRQEVIAENYARMLGTEVLTPRHIVERIVGDPAAQMQLMTLALPSMQGKLDGLTAELATSCGVSGRLETSTALTAVLPHLGEVLPAIEGDLYDHLEKQLDIIETLRSSLASMDKLEFEKVLRSIFQEDEAMLIGIGGVLGAAIGTLQATVVLAI